MEGECVNTLQYNHTMAYYSAVKNEVPRNATIWRKLKIIFRSEKKSNIKECRVYHSTFMKFRNKLYLDRIHQSGGSVALGMNWSSFGVERIFKILCLFGVSLTHMINLSKSIKLYLRSVFFTVGQLASAETNTQKYNKRRAQYLCTSL